jgi:REP-associated tyrosine transposase
MSVPYRGRTGTGTYFITASTWQKMCLFQTDRMSHLFLDTLFHYRNERNYFLHEFVLMPNHFHLLLTPIVTLEKSIQLIKGGFSFRAKKELGYAGEVWESSFYDRRVRDCEEYQRMKNYIHQNPVERRLAEIASQFPYSSAAGGFTLDEVPQRLKPLTMTG